ncbi:syndecan-4 [Rhinichthys klamathensis goyatoka]|uniref:syndecan-4 n=1 Tax=Rhinichthys klamathensis goyatoka TaxID=3034132 RepID=UPI0024B55E39|nr:syndecan-4 [Rhinichthys klamathensis goyatoka]
MLKVYLMLVLSAAAAVFAESVRETETWVPLKTESPHEDLESSGDSPHQDFEFAGLNPIDDEDVYDDDDEEDDYDDISGSGSSEILIKNDQNNRISDPVGPFAPLPTIDETILVKNNEVGLGESPNQENGQQSNVLMTIAGEESLFNNTEVLAAIIAGGAIGLIFAILLIVFLVHFVLRIKKKDEGSYDLGKTPIYKKAPTAEIYA